MSVFLALLSIVLILVILADGFEVMLLPRRVTRTFRPARFYYRNAWRLWGFGARAISPGKRREYFMSMFGPLSLLGLLAAWVAVLIFSFGLLHWSLGTPLQEPDKKANFGKYVYFSGTTFFTLGYGDITPIAPLGRSLAVVEAGLGFGFIAVIIGYLPVLYQAFSRREMSIALLDARAGSPPTAGEFLLRASRAGTLMAIDPFLSEWERWSAELLESHISFPLLSYYRSQHDNQSWLAALTAVLDTCSLLIVMAREKDPYQPQLTFAMARHAVVDLALVFQSPPQPIEHDRLPREKLCQLRQMLRQAGMVMREGEAIEKRLCEMREMYEPFLNGLGQYFMFTLPPVLPEKAVVDNWQTTAWARRAPGIGKLPPPREGDEHSL
jgi:Ion channel